VLFNCTNYEYENTVISKLANASIKIEKKRKKNVNKTCYVFTSGIKFQIRKRQKHTINRTVTMIWYLIAIGYNLESELFLPSMQGFETWTSMI